MNERRHVAGEVTADFPTLDRQDEDQLLPQLVAHLREHRTKLRQEWASRIQDAHLLQAMTPQEMAAETTSVYDNYVEVLETGSVEALQHYARDLSERIIPRGVETHEVVGIVLLLRDVLARSLFEKYQRRLRAAQPGAGRLRAGREPDREHRRGQLRRRARAGHPPAAGLHPRAVHAGPAGPGTTAHPAHHRRAGQRAGPAADRAAADRHPHPPREGGRHRHHRRPGRRRGGRQPPRADRRRLTSDGGQRHHHRTVSGDRPDPGHDRRRPEQDEHDRGPAGGPGGGRTAARATR